MGDRRRPGPERGTASVPRPLVALLVLSLAALALASGALLWERTGGLGGRLSTAGAAPPTAPVAASSPVAATGPAPGGGSVALVTATAAGEDAEAVAAVLTDYAEGITAADYERAYDQLTPARRAREPLEVFSDLQSTSRWQDVVVREVTRSGDALRAVTTFTTRQSAARAPAPGLTCTEWHLVFVLEPGGEHGWQISTSEDVPGAPRVTACGA